MKTQKHISNKKKNKTRKIATRMINLGELFSDILIKNNIRFFFGVPSDLNMPLLDGMIKEPVQFIGCRNELNASYMAEGFARTKNFSYCVVGSMVGSLSACNGIANAICEKHPVILLTGGNNSNDILDGKLSHHTLFKGIEDQDKSYQVYKTLCGESNSFLISSLNPTGIYNTIFNISESISNFNSPYVQIPANLQLVKGKFDYSNDFSSNFNNKTIDFDKYKFYNIVNNILQSKFENKIESMRSLNPVFLFGSAYNHYGKFTKLADDNFYNLIENMNGKLFYTIDAKGILDETKKCVLGYYWGGVTEEYKLKYFNSTKLLIYICVEFSDYTSAGYTCLYKPDISIDCKNISVLNLRPGKLNNFNIGKVSHKISTAIQGILDSNTDIFVETGSSWFYGAKMTLPTGCRYNISIKYGSIGWCFPASIGNAFANPDRKTICLTGDGAFQCVLQEISTAETYDVNMTLILINNDVYQIENVLDVEEYNDLPDYNYESLAKAMKCKSVTTCTIDNFKKNLELCNSKPGFNVVILKISDKEIDNLMKNWAKLEAKYTAHFNPRKKI